MITQTARAPFILRATTPWAWRSRRRIAMKLMGFAATEHGSALDMLRAADRTHDARLRRLFFRHGLDEARHAQRFRDAAKALDPAAAELTRAHEKLHGVRQDLHERLGEVAFVAFVHRSEARAKAQFDVLAAHFSDHPEHPELGRLFSEIGKDERGHVAYSRQLLDEWRAAGRAREVARAERSVRLSGAWQAWRRQGRRIGDVMVRLLLLALFIGVVPLFALMSRLGAKRAGHDGTWVAAPPDAISLESLRRQS
ncbi:MAG: hypothetical protein U1F43_27695 [Myxococcota bacterium]